MHNIILREIESRNISDIDSALYFCRNSLENVTQISGSIKILEFKNDHLLVEKQFENILKKSDYKIKNRILCTIEKLNIFNIINKQKINNKEIFKINFNPYTNKVLENNFSLDSLKILSEMESIDEECILKSISKLKELNNFDRKKDSIFCFFSDLRNQFKYKIENFEDSNGFKKWQKENFIFLQGLLSNYPFLNLIEKMRKNHLDNLMLNYDFYDIFEPDFNINKEIFRKNLLNFLEILKKKFRYENKSNTVRLIKNYVDTLTNIFPISLDKINDIKSIEDKTTEHKFLIKNSYKEDLNKYSKSTISICSNFKSLSFSDENNDYFDFYKENKYNSSLGNHSTGKKASLRICI